MLVMTISFCYPFCIAIIAPPPFLFVVTRYSSKDGGIADLVEDLASVNNASSRPNDPDERHLQIRTQGVATTSCLESVQDDEGIHIEICLIRLKLFIRML